MNQFFNTFYDGYKNTSIPKYKIFKLSNNQTNKEKNIILLEEQFISNNVKNEIKKFNNCYKIECLSKLQKNYYPYNSNKYIPRIELYYFTKNKNNNEHLPTKKINILLRRLFFISNLYSKLSQDSTPVRCWICPTYLKKRLPSNKNNILGPNEVNSGLCIPDKRNIILWRNEELNKVLIHELIHTFKLDKKLYETNLLKNYIYNTINISKKNEINPNETYTETLAILLNTIFNIIDKNNINSISKKSLYRKYIKQINTEIEFSINQASKILLYNGYTNINELINKNTNKKNNIYNWKQNTNVLSYYILKIAILYNLKQFIIYLKHTNNLYINNSNNFIKILDESLNNKAFIKKINDNIKKIKDNRYKNINNSSLRMSVY